MKQIKISDKSMNSGVNFSSEFEIRKSKQYLQKVSEIAHALQKERGCKYNDVLKEAHRKAFEMLSSKTAGVTYDALVAKMQHGQVKFVHKNARGQEITSVGTLDAEYIARREKGRNGKTEGRRTAKNDSYGVYFDVKHGFFRPVVKANIVSID